ncbi:peptidoglycan-binding protein [Kitasatospora sp. NPDC056181]|uniref:peptidoglycan-binding protein n=1 Tax=Kitasatospora sp. NPDC056181 TaxID=3345737 RepID=UPI0035D588D1
MTEFEGKAGTVKTAGDGPGDGPEPWEDGSGRHGLRRRRRLLLVVVAAAVTLSGGGLAASLVIKSPAQAAAESKPPPADVLTAPVEKRVLTDSVVVRGLVSAGQSVDVAPAGGAAGGAGAKPVVTKLPLKAGDQAQAGQSVLEVAGRPVFALKGDLPVYRDLRPGATGQDVKQLRQALKELGFGSDDDPEGAYGAATKAAVQAFYAARGYDPLPASPDGDAQVSAAQDAVTGGERALSDAKDALKAAQRRYDDAVAAQRARQSAPAQPSATAAPGGTAGASAGAAAGDAAGGAPGTAGAGSTGAGSTGAGSATGGAGSAGENPADAARTAVDTAQKQVTRAGEDLAKLRRKAADVRAATGPMVPAAELLFLSGFPARVDAVTGRIGGEVSGKVLTVSAGALVVRGSLSVSDKGLVHPGQQVEILSELAGTKAAGKVTAVADTPGDPQQSGTGGTGGSGQQGGGTNQGGGTGQGGGPAGYQLVVEPDAPLDPKLAGQDVRLTVRAASSAGPVLVVPLSAVSATADGRTVVTVYGNGQRRRVEVTPGTVGGGSAEVRPLIEGSLGPGDQVIVGVKDADRAGAP